MLEVSAKSAATAVQCTDLNRLREVCAATKTAGFQRAAAISTTLPDVDQALSGGRGEGGGGLAAGSVHELLGLFTPDASPASPRGLWLPPLTMLVHLARCVLAASHLPARLVWIGQNLFPFPQALGADALAASLFVRAARPQERLWAADLALRSGAVGAVILDASDFPMVATRRLQLAAESSRSLCLIAKPPWQQHVLTAAHTRWRVSPAPSPTLNRRFRLELIRCKGLRTTAQDGSGSCGSWLLEVHHATRTLSLAADLRDRSGDAPPAHARGHDPSNAIADHPAHPARRFA